MSTYTLNTVGQTEVAAAVRAADKRELVDDAYFDDAEQAANDAFDSGADAIIEVHGIWSVTGNPITIRLAREWFDVEQVEE